MPATGVKDETQSKVWCWGDLGAGRRLGREGNRDMGLGAVRDEADMKPEVRAKRLHRGPGHGEKG